VFHFTKQERFVLVVLAAIIVCGSTSSYALKKYPRLFDIVNLIESDKITAKVDLNTATREELVDIPYIGEYTASNILKYRKDNGAFQSVESIKKVKGIRDKNYQKFAKYLKITKKK